MNEQSTIQYVFDYSSFAILMLVLAIIFIVITLIRYKVKKRKPTVLLVISSMLVLATIVFFVLGHFFGVESEKIDLNQAKEQARIAENIQNNKVDHVLEDIDKLYPKDEVKGMDASNRFVLLWNYYKKIGDTRKAKELINEAKNNPEIDKEDDFKRKGPSKENRKEPIVGLGLLLDANQIPIGMKLFPGNQSEKPVIRTVIDDLKKRNSVSGRTIQIADKGLNCAENIFHALKNGDGYIFSKSVKLLPEIERTWVLLPNGYRDIKNENGDVLYRIKECVDEFEYKFNDSETGKVRKFKITEKRIVTFNPKLAKKQIFEINKEVAKAKLLKASQAKRSEYGDSAKYVIFTTTDKKGNDTDGKVKVTMNEELIQRSLELAGYNMLVTSEISMHDKAVYTAYHNLWRIEESFRVMKTQLDARPVYLQKEDTIIGHFLICYLAVLLTRLLQFKVLKNNYCTEDLFDFIRDFRVAQISDRKYINLSRATPFIKEFTALCNLPLTSYFLSNGEIKKMLSRRF